MSATAGGGSRDGLTPSLVQRLDHVCNQFEAAWKTAAGTGQRPRIEDYLTDLPAGTRDFLREPQSLRLDRPRPRRAGLCRFPGHRGCSRGAR
jgi:hypothetical protein